MGIYVTSSNIWLFLTQVLFVELIYDVVCTYISVIGSEQIRFNVYSRLLKAQYEINEALFANLIL